MGIFGNSNRRSGRSNSIGHDRHDIRSGYNGPGGPPEYTGRNGNTGVHNGSITDSSIADNNYNRGVNTSGNNYDHRGNNNMDNNYDHRGTNNMDNNYDRRGNNNVDSSYNRRDNRDDDYDRRGRNKGIMGGMGGMGRRNRRLGKHNRDEKSYNNKGNKEKRALFDINSGYYNRRPSFGTWLKYTWLDIVTMIILGAIGLGVYEANPAPSRSFPVTFTDGEVVYPQFAYPLRKEIIPIWAAALIGSLVPIFVILCMQIRIKSFWDVNNAIIGLLYSLIGAAVFQVFVKWLIGGLRPHFLEVCQPDMNRVAGGGAGFGNIMWKSDICTGDQNQINDSLESMPSGHSTAAFAGLLFLYFYLNGKLKVFSNHHPAMWKLIALYAPVLGATLIAGSLTIDEFHNWYDCLAGAIIGSIFAISSYRMVYASVWDFRFNHIPLTRHTPFSYGAGSAGAGGFESCVFTHKAGWGYEEAYGGAPFDSAFALRGMNGGGMTGGGGVISGNEHSVGLGHKNTGHRHGDVEHNAAGAGAGATAAGVGLGHHNHNKNHGLGHHNRHDNVNDTYNTTAGSGLTGPTATHDGNLNHHHQHGLTGSTTARDNTFNNNSSGIIGPMPARNDNAYNTTTGTGGITTNRDNNMVHDGVTHSNANRDSNLVHHGITGSHNNRDGILHNHNNDGLVGTRDNDFNQGTNLPREGRSDMIGDNRYQTHRKSLERKAIVNSGQGVY